LEQISGNFPAEISELTTPPTNGAIQVVSAGLGRKLITCRNQVQCTDADGVNYHNSNNKDIK